MEMTPCRLNLDFENILAGKSAKANISEWDHSFFFLSESDECLVSDKTFSPAYTDYLREVWQIEPQLCEGEHTPRDWWGDTQNLERERKLNSKVWAREFARLAGRDLDFPSYLVGDEQTLGYAYDMLQDFSTDIVMKSPFGFSGKGFKVFQKKMPFEKLKDQVFKQVEKNGPVLLESWVERETDFRYTVTKDGLQNLARLLIDKQGEFRGVTDTEIPQLELSSELADMLESFFGDHFPFQIDGFIYRDPLNPQKKRVREISEINHRRSLGEMLFRCRELKGLTLKAGASWVVVKRREKYPSFSALLQKIKDLNLEESVFPTSDHEGVYMSFFVVHHFTLPPFEQLEKLFFGLGESFPLRH